MLRSATLPNRQWKGLLAVGGLLCVGVWLVLWAQPSDPSRQPGFNALAAVLLVMLCLMGTAWYRGRARAAACERHIAVLDAVLASQPVAVIVTDTTGAIEWVNCEFERATGYRMEEVLGRHPSFLANRAAAQTAGDMWSGLKAGDSWEGRLVNLRKDGSEYHLDATIAPVFSPQGRCIAMVCMYVDVSRAEQEHAVLQRSERRLKETLDQRNALFDSAPPVVLTGDGRIQRFNPAFAALLGAEPSQLQNQPTHVLFGGVEQHATFAVKVGSQLAQGLPAREYWHLQRLDGGRVEVILSGRSVQIEGCEQAAIWVIEDVTEARRAAQAERETSERLELVQEAGKTNVFDVDLRTGRGVWRHKVANVEGISEREVVDWRAAWQERLLPNEREAAVARLDAVLQSSANSFHDAWRLRRFEGGVRWFACSAKIVRDAQGKAERIVGVNVDIDAYKKLEEQVAAQVQFQRVLMDTIPVPIFYKDEEGRYLGFNRAYEETFGIRREHFLGRTVQSLQYLSPDSRDQFEADARIALDGAEAVHREAVMPTADGELRHMLFWLQGFRKPDGTPGGVIGTFVDISERERAEQELRRAKELAEEATALKSNFLANMSHEIRTPMNAIVGMSHLALKSGLNARQHDYVSKIRQAGEHLMGVINGILDFSRIEAGKMQIDMRPFSLDQVLGGVVDVVSHNANAKGLELICDVAADVPPNLVGDALRLGQVLINFSNNAVKFTSEGEVGIVVRVQHREGPAEQVWLRFEVRDTGIGIDASHAGRLFQSFQQADTSTTRRYGGTGLGLAISKSLAELMGGEVGVLSQPGKGSTFWFTVPLARGAPARALLPSSDIRGLRVLVVDDNVHACAVIAEMLQSMSFEVREVHSGTAALSAVQQAENLGQPFDLVVLDWQMPGMDGLELARRLGELHLARPPRRIMVTAFGREDVLRSAQSQGIEEVLIKPVNASVMFDTLMQLLGGLPEHAVTALPRIAGRPPGFAMPGTRVLVVEDNELNQQVAREMLEEVGVQVALARNGEEGVVLAFSQPFDLVLMDMQMPVMDGLEATRRIRENPLLNELPIVAMTANAMEADRQRCLDAGMNGHLAKPIAPAMMWQTLAPWLTFQPLGALSGQHHADRQGSGESPLPPDLPELDVAQGLRNSLGRSRLYADLLRRFIDTQSTAAERIARDLQGGLCDQAARDAHTLRGLAGTVGASAVQQAAGHLEDHLRGGAADTPETQPLLGTLHAALHALGEALGGWIRTQPREPGGETEAAAKPSQAARIAVAQLGERLQRDDPDARNFAREHASLLSQALGPALEGIQCCIDRFDFELALAALTGSPAPPPQMPGHPTGHSRKGSSHAA